MALKNSLPGKLALTILTCLILVFILIVSDRLYGKYFTKHTQALIYPPCTSANHKSSEFDITVNINALGFRDQEYSLQKKKKYRVAVIGDSFTFGWGVNLEDCWVKLLEKELNASGLDVEILNLGKGGASPADYAQTATSTISLLKPDLVIVGALQANDLHQLIHAYDSLPLPQVQQPQKSYIAQKSFNVLNRAFPNFMRSLSVKNISISEQWEREAPALLQSFQPVQKDRFDALDETVKTNFNSGLLNPWLIHQAVYYPEYFTQPLDTADLDVVIGTSALADFLVSIKQVCTSANSEIAVIAIPNAPYSSAEQLNSLKKFGFALPDSLLGNKLADEPIRMAAEEAGISFYSSFESFRKNGSDKVLYYQYDGHFTPEGNRVFATSVSGFIKEKTESLK